MSVTLTASRGVMSGWMTNNLSENPLTRARRSSIGGLPNKRNRVFGSALKKTRSPHGFRQCRPLTSLVGSGSFVRCARCRTPPMSAAASSGCTGRPG